MAANVDAPTGLKPVDHLLGLDWSDKVRRCYLPASDGSALFLGDAVDLAGAADATGGYPTIAKAVAGAGNPIFGVIIGFEPDPDNLKLLYRPASTARFALVCCDPFVIYEIQGSSDAVLANTIVGANGVLIFTHGGSTATGISGMELSAATTPASDPSYQLLILGAARREDNDIAYVNAKWHVTISLNRLLPNYGATSYQGVKGI